MIYCFDNSRAVDYWSLGIVLHEVLVGIPPFQDDNVLTLYGKIVKGNLQNNFVDIKDSAVDLIRKLLQHNPASRLGYLKGGIMDIRLHK